MNLNDIATQLLYSVVPIFTKSDTKNATGTGFIYNHNIEESNNQVIPFLITNRHLIQDADKVLVAFAEKENEIPKESEKITIELSKSTFMNFSDEENDLVAYPIGGILNTLIESNKAIFYKGITSSIFPNEEELKNLSALEDLTIIGYPTMFSEHSQFKPIIQKGYTATQIWDSFPSKNQFLIDFNVFPGASGSPVFLLNRGSYNKGDNVILGTRLLFLGIVSSVFKVPNNFSYRSNLTICVNSDVIKNFVNNIVERLNTTPNTV